MFKKLIKLFNKNKLLLFFFIVCIVILVISNNNEGFVDNKEYDIVIIAGQSNAQGNGEAYFTPGYQGMPKDKIDEPLYNDPYFQKDKENISKALNDDLVRKNKIKMFTSDNKIVSAEDPLQHFKQTKIKEKQNPHGFGIPFARQYVKEKNKDVLLLGCAMGSTAFKFYGPANGGNNDERYNFGWKEGDSSSNVCNGKDCSLFKMSKERIKAAKVEAPNSRVVAILWHQGESDASHNPSEYYASGVSQMLKKLRSYAIEQFPDSPANFPILVGGLCTYFNDYSETDKQGKLKKNYRSTMNYILKSMENAGDNIRFVPSDNSLGSKFNHPLRPNSRSSDGGKIHFSRMAQIEFGYRYYYIFNNKSINFN